MFAQSSSRQALASALTIALDDEYRARASYRTILNAYGEVWPFTAIVQAEQRHIEALLPLFQCYGVEPPADRWRGNIAPPASLQVACQAGAAAEVSNYQMYDSLLGQVFEEDVRQVFWALRNASALHHLPAFQTCAANHSPEMRTAFDNTGVPTKAGLDLKTVVAGVCISVGALWLFNRAKESRLTKD